MVDYVYVFVRQDLSWPDMVVQACHAAMESQRHAKQLGIDYGFAKMTVPEYQYETPHLVLIGIRSKEKLAAVQAELTGLAVVSFPFVEPDMNGELTAVATERLGETDERRKPLSRYKLLNEARA